MAIKFRYHPDVVIERDPIPAPRVNDPEVKAKVDETLARLRRADRQSDQAAEASERLSAADFSIRINAR